MKIYLLVLLLSLPCYATKEEYKNEAPPTLSREKILDKNFIKLAQNKNKHHINKKKGDLQIEVASFFSKNRASYLKIEARGKNHKEAFEVKLNSKNVHTQRVVCKNKTVFLIKFQEDTSTLIHIEVFNEKGRSLMDFSSFFSQKA